MTARNGTANGLAATQQNADRSGGSWFPEEDALVLHPGRTIREVALLLGRTTEAVKNRRRKLKARLP
jgi:hypothetical protein